jgi:hypothetical protein
MRKYDIALISPSASPATPSVIQLSATDGNVTASFHGKEWIDASGVRSPFYAFDTDPLSVTPAPPVGTVTLVATTFDIGGNTKYNGRYTVYTKQSLGGYEPAEFLAGATTIRVNETMATNGVGAELTDGYVTNISTYVFNVQGEAPLVVLEQREYESRPIELSGRLTTGWGEVMYQNMIRHVQNFASDTAPPNPFLGQLWFDTISGILKINVAAGAASWQPVSAASVGSAFRHTQSAPASTWTITHSLSLTTPFIAESSFYIDIGGGVYKPILPSDITYVSANQLAATFSTPEAGYAIIRG